MAKYNICHRYQAPFLGMGALGIATMWEAVFADVGVAVIAILNSLRAMK